MHSSPRGRWWTSTRPMQSVDQPPAKSSANTTRTGWSPGAARRRLWRACLRARRRVVGLNAKSNPLDDSYQAPKQLRIFLVCPTVQAEHVFTYMCGLTQLYFSARVSPRNVPDFAGVNTGASGTLLVVRSPTPQARGEGAGTARHRLAHDPAYRAAGLTNQCPVISDRSSLNHGRMTVRAGSRSAGRRATQQQETCRLQET